jgi:ribosomal protein L37E
MAEKCNRIPLDKCQSPFGNSTETRCTRCGRRSYAVICLSCEWMGGRYEQVPTSQSECPYRSQKN